MSMALHLPRNTLGGLQLWADRFVHACWRIQEHVSDGRCRLLDPDDVIRAEGDFAACRAAFEGLRPGIVEPPPHLVLLLHGLGRTGHCFAALRKELVARGYDACAINYPSLRRPIAAHAAQLAEILERLEGAAMVSFVTHSLGGIVLRHTLAMGGGWSQRIALGRIVMMAPPSKGAAIAAWLKDFPPFRWIAGPCGQELVPAAMADAPALAGQFGIIAGGRGDGRGYNPFLPGDNDGIVAVEEMKLDGCAAFTLVPCLHSFLPSHPAAIAAALAFIERGTFPETTS